MACSEHAKMIHKTDFWRAFSAFAAVFAFVLGYMISSFASNDKVDGLQQRIIRNEQDIAGHKKMMHEVQRDISEIKIMLEKAIAERHAND